MYGNIHFKGCPELGSQSHHYGWVETSHTNLSYQFQINHSDVTNHPFQDNL
jgi:hypothetical protein